MNRAVTRAAHVTFQSVRRGVSVLIVALVLRQFTCKSAFLPLFVISRLFIKFMECRISSAQRVRPQRALWQWRRLWFLAGKTLVCWAETGEVINLTHKNITLNGLEVLCTDGTLSKVFCEERAWLQRNSQLKVKSINEPISRRHYTALDINSNIFKIKDIRLYTNHFVINIFKIILVWWL